MTRLACVVTGQEAVRVGGLPVCPVHDFTECLAPPLSELVRLDRRIDRLSRAAQVLVLGWAAVCAVMYLAGLVGTWPYVLSSLQPPVAMYGGHLLAHGRTWVGLGLVLGALVAGATWPWL